MYIKKYAPHNADLLEEINEVIESKGLKHRYIARQLNVHYETLSRKLRGVSKFSKNELDALELMLGVTFKNKGGEDK